MGTENGTPSPEEMGLNSSPETDKKKPFFGFRDVVKAKLDATVPFEGAITKTTSTERGFLYTVVGRTEDGREVTETVLEDDLKRYNESELGLWQ